MNSRTRAKVIEAEYHVETAKRRLETAQANYLRATKRLTIAQVADARANPHEWLGMSVYRIMTAIKGRSRIERGTVQFKDFDTPDYGNPHIAIGHYYVLTEKQTAHQLDQTWLLELL
jgi:hypothetical protein